MGRKILLAAALSLFLLSTAQAQTSHRIGTQGYVGLALDTALFTPGLAFRGGVNNLLIPNLGVRAEVGFYLSGLKNLGFSVLYHMPPLEAPPLSFYGGLGPRLLLSRAKHSAQSFFSLSGFLGGEYELQGLHLFLELSDTAYFLYQTVFIPGVTLGINVYF